MANKNKNNKKKCISHSSRAGLQVLSPFFSSLELSLCIGVHFFLGRFVLFCALFGTMAKASLGCLLYVLIDLTATAN